MASEKIEIQRHYVMVSSYTRQIDTYPFIALYVLFQYYEMSYGLNVEMHKQVCISDYLGIYKVYLPFFD